MTRARRREASVALAGRAWRLDDQQLRSKGFRDPRRHAGLDAETRQLGGRATDATGLMESPAGQPRQVEIPLGIEAGEAKSERYATPSISRRIPWRRPVAIAVPGRLRREKILIAMVDERSDISTMERDMRGGDGKVRLGPTIDTGADPEAAEHRDARAEG